MRYYSEEAVKKIMDAVKVDYVPTSQFDSSLCIEERKYPRLEDYPSIEIPYHWHTGTPTEEGWYLLECNIGNSDETYYVTDYWNNEVGYWTVNRVIRWQKIKED